MIADFWCLGRLKASRVAHRAARGKVFTVSRACSASLYLSKMLVSLTTMEMSKLSTVALRFIFYCWDLSFGLSLMSNIMWGRGTRLDGEKNRFLSNVAAVIWSCS